MGPRAVDLLVYLLLIAVSGLIVGALGRFALHGKDPMSLGQTILVGIAGSLIGGIIAGLIWGRDNPGYALPIQVGCATAIVYAVRRRRERTAERTGFR